MADRQNLSEGSERALAVDWASVCERAAGRLAALFAEYPTMDSRLKTVGQGAGGDQTLEIDWEAEGLVFDELKQLNQAGADFTVVSEERGIVDFGGGPVHVVVDPIDGSLNAKRVGLSYSLSIAVAEGPSMEDVVFGYVYDFGSGEHWTAERGRGAWLNGALIDPEAPGNGLEIVGLEASKPANLSPELVDHFGTRVNRLRSIGSIALTLCQVAAARFDGMCSLRACRSVDAAAGQLIVREAGGQVAFGDFDNPLAVPLDLTPHAPVVAARDAERLRFLLDGLAL